MTRSTRLDHFFLQFVGDRVVRSALLFAGDQILKFFQQNALTDRHALPRQFFLGPLLQFHVDRRVKSPEKANVRWR